MKVKSMSLTNEEYAALYEKLEELVSKTVVTDEVLFTQLKTVPETLGLVLIDKGFNIIAEDVDVEAALAVFADIIHYYSGMTQKFENEGSILYGYRSEKIH